MSLINKISKFFNSKTPETENKIMVPDYIGKLVHQNSMVIGESIAVEENRIVIKIKNLNVFMSIPIEAVLTNTETIVVEDFNREESLQRGKEWFERRDTLKFDEKGMLIINSLKSQ